MQITVDSLSAQRARALLDELVTLYRDAFGGPPYCKGEEEVAEFAQSFPRHVEAEGFRIVAAWRNETGPVVGFAYGYANSSDQWWYKEVAKAVPEWVVKEWLRGSFRLVEMAVAPEAQRRGIGGLLHDQLLGEVPYRKAVLSTMAAETPAYRMYQERGWRVLLDDYLFPGVDRPYRVLGLALGATG